MDGFVATFANRLDQKGRVSVPAPFRTVLAREGQDGVYCYPALDRPAIDGGGARLRDEIAKRLHPFETFSEDHESLSTAFYGESRSKGRRNRHATLLVEPVYECRHEAVHRPSRRHSARCNVGRSTAGPGLDPTPIRGRRDRALWPGFHGVSWDFMGGQWNSTESVAAPACRLASGELR